VKTVLGIDSSSSVTGWSLLRKTDSNEIELVDYGLISPQAPMSVTQRLYFFGNEIKKLIERLTPNEITIEETILVRGPKIMRTLARFSGVALYQAYCYQKREVMTYEPPSWKKKMGLSGHAKKPQIQLAICKRFKLLDDKKIEEYAATFSAMEEEVNKLRLEVRQKSKQFEIEIKKLHRESNENKATREIGKVKIGEVNEKRKTFKKEADKKIKEYEKNVVEMSTNIYSDCGINPDIADSIGVAVAFINDGK
jgi:crossover junction endodeoxyribonuclease RuvC